MSQRTCWIRLECPECGMEWEAQCTAEGIVEEFMECAECGAEGEPSGKVQG